MRGMFVGEFFPLGDEPEAPAPTPIGEDGTLKISTRVTVRQHKDMKIAAAEQGISIEDAYRAAVERFLSTEPGEWHPILTAPKDGTRVLLYFPKLKHVTECVWASPNGVYRANWCNDGQWFPHEPTHWRTLPEPPKGRD